MVEKDLFGHFDKHTNALLHAKAKETRLQEALQQTSIDRGETATAQLTDSAQQKL